MSKMLCRLIAISFVAVSITALAQSGDAMKHDGMKQGDQMKHENMKADNMSQKAVSVSGKVSADGKMFVSDNDNKTWTVSNPDALKSHEGHHVTVQAHADGSKNELHVNSVHMAKDEMKPNMSKNEMKH